MIEARGVSPRSAITVLGIDPGFAAVGYAEVSIDCQGECVERMGVVRTAKSAKRQKVLAADDDTRRTRILSMELGTLISSASIVCAESMSIPFVPGKGGKGRVPAVKAAVQTARCWGVITTHAQIQRKALLEATPQQVKKAVCGKANASKDEVQQALEVMFDKRRLTLLLAGVPASARVHAYDALATAVACIDSDEVRMLLVTARQPAPSMATGAG